MEDVRDWYWLALKLTADREKVIEEVKEAVKALDEMSSSLKNSEKQIREALVKTIPRERLGDLEYDVAAAESLFLEKVCSFISKAIGLCLDSLKRNQPGNIPNALVCELKQVLHRSRNFPEQICEQLQEMQGLLNE